MTPLLPAPLDVPALLARLTGLPPARAAGLLARAPLGTLVKESPAALASLYDLTPTQAGVLHAGLTLGRLTCTQVTDGPRKLATPREVAAYLIPEFGHAALETFGIVGLSIKHRLLGVRVVSTGDLSSTVVHPREVFRLAVELRAASVVLFHNHPSGDPQPSADDLVLTTRLVAAGEVLGIRVDDHVILTDQRYFSFQEAGRLGGTIE